MKYRREIDGLRALAVVPVILYHAGISIFGGGYVGVDVFFVISGYLITSLIAEELNENRFSIVKFYERRARRILPALFFVVGCCVPFAWIWMLPIQFKLFGQALVATSVFASNIFFAFKNDYFTGGSAENPLIHTWSLAVEEQYYIIFPLLLIVIWKYRRRSALPIIVIFALASFALAQWASRIAPTANFYLAPTRFWELLIGSICALMPARKCGSFDNVFSIVGLVAIILSILWFDNNTPFPSVYALLPVLGAGLVILFATEDTLVKFVLSRKELVGIGLISYSAYLWHQPVFAFARIRSVTPPTGWQTFLLAGLSLLLAYFSWRYIELPFRGRTKGFSITRGQIFSGSASVASALVAFGLYSHFDNGIPQRQRIFSRMAINSGFGLQCNGSSSYRRDCASSPSPALVLWGDSYAMQLVQGFRSYSGQGILRLTRQSCAPVLGVHAPKDPLLPDCTDFNSETMKHIEAMPNVRYVVLSSTFRFILKKRGRELFDESLERLLKTGKVVILVGPAPSTGLDFSKCILRAHQSHADLETCNFSRENVEPNHWKKIWFIREFAKKYDLKFVDLTDIICGDVECHVYSDGKIIYNSMNHLSHEGSDYVVSRMHLEELLQTQPRSRGIGKL